VTALRAAFGSEGSAYPTLSASTSALARREHELSGSAATHRAIVRSVLGKYPDSTAEELVCSVWNEGHRRLGEDIVEVRRRLTDLLNSGEAFQSGYSYPPRSSKKVVCWSLRDRQGALL
jgi:hypothetical protein